MPLQPGSSKEAISANVSRLVREGYPQKQAVAIAFSQSKKKPSLSSRLAKAIIRKFGNKFFVGMMRRFD